MKPHFVECSAPVVAIPFWGVLYNVPINLTLCKSLRKKTMTDEHAKDGRKSVPYVAFDGCDASWFFETEEQRDAEMKRLISEN